MSEIDYLRLRFHLDHPRPNVLPDWLETLHPHATPADPEWPFDSENPSTGLWAIGERLSWTASLVGAIVAAEMLLSRILNAAGPNHPQVVPTRRAISHAYDFLAGTASFAEFWSASRAFPSRDGEHIWVFEIFVNILQSEWFRDDFAEAARRWWRRCRSRLAVFDPARFNDERVVEEIDRALDDPHFRADAIRQLEFFRALGTFRTLVRFFLDEEESYDVRMAAIESLKTFNRASDVPMLLKALRDADEWVRYHAIHKLAGIPSAARELRAAALVIARFDPSSRVRDLATNTLRNSRDWVKHPPTGRIPAGTTSAHYPNANL